VLDSLAQDLENIVSELTTHFISLFKNYDQCKAGITIQKITRSIFEDWCKRSLQVTPECVLSTVLPMLSNPAFSQLSLSLQLITSILKSPGWGRVWS
jgi:hypothetical protein